jgi:hypothetical protein
LGEKAGAVDLSFEDILKIEQEAIYNQTKVGERIEPKDSVSWYRKQINTRLSKLQRKEGKRSTHIAEMMKMLKGLQMISPKDASEMAEKISDAT